MNPLLFIPSPRDIPEVKKTWHEIPYDKFIVKYTPEYEAYQMGKKFFMEHEEYTHLIICPDDLEISKYGIERLMYDAEVLGYETVSGISNIDESRPDLLAIYKTNCQYDLGPSVGFGDTISRDMLPDKLFEVGHAGFCCQIISRKLLEKVSLTGWETKGYFDWQFSVECHRLGVKIMCDPLVEGYHRRFQQRVSDMKKQSMRDDNIGYTLWLKDR